MFRILFADDNELTRKALRESISWEKMNCSIVGEAEDGLQALQLIKEEKPDIVIIDIQMPGKSGLEVAEEIGHLKLPIKFIIITGYNDFKYAQKGIQIGVIDFILKPINNEQLIEVIDRVKQIITKEKGEQSAYRKLIENEIHINEELNRNSRELKKKLLNEGINGFVPDINATKKMFRDDWAYGKYELCIIKPDEVINCLANLSSEEINRFVKEQEEIIENQKLLYCVKAINTWMDGGVILALFFQNVQITKEYHLQTLRLANYIYDKNLSAYGRKVTIGISNAYKEFQSLQQAYEEANFALNSRFFLENKNIIHIGAVKSKSISNDYCLMKQVEELYRIIKEEPQEAGSCLNKIFDMLREGKNYDVDYVRNIFVNICIMLNRIISTNDNTIPIKCVNEIMDELGNMTSLSTTFTWVQSYVTEMIFLISQNEYNDYSPATRNMIGFLNRRYSEKITLQDLADYVGLSPSHVCRILKNETGETFVLLLNKIRIQAAIRLLKEGKQKVYEVADEVGFSNYAYFYQLFKKETGQPPTNFH